MPPEKLSLAVEPSVHQLDAEDMDEIIDLILQGKYSGACLLLLESIGQDPLNYIPYRTYNRLQKQRQQAVLSSIKAKESALDRTTASLGSRLADLDYIEPLSRKRHHTHGGFGFASSTLNCRLLKTELTDDEDGREQLEISLFGHPF